MLFIKYKKYKLDHGILPHSDLHKLAPDIEYAPPVSVVLQ